MSKKAAIVLSCIIAAICGLWIWTAITPKNAISIGGSTSVDPVMQRLTNQYRKESKESFIYSSSGSQGGVKNVNSNAYKMGFISKEIPNDGSIDYIKPDEVKKPSPNLTNGQEITNYLNETREFGDKLHTIKIATDSIILTYNAPKIFKDTFGDMFTITVNEKGIADEKSQELVKFIYSRPNNKFNSWSQVAEKLVQQSGQTKTQAQQNAIDELEKDKKRNEFQSFSREPGSGTRNSFEKQMGLYEDKSSTKYSSVLNSNGMMYQEMTRASSFGYLSLNYLDAIKDSGNELHTVTIKNLKGDKFVPEEMTDFKEYPLNRPYIGLFKANLSEKYMEKIANFIAWMAEAQVANEVTHVENDQLKQYRIEGLTPTFELDGVKWTPKA
ncbi:phosphate ABC transporter substrate-binding protein [Mesoplasma lactucae]|uniref:Phosphate ABC transporter substrate-binding protein n=1 Tax=Mesoplasma lactucae ATCC 49193 TaxID=81460 RepID=A0A291IS11_9MOLU|nr:phosphate ABC transporter substrate-binding protein [Mesoplasma lactucae]ATG97528.1 phosphate ABC transporter substrate-binding protein [Mesoplasma lactucae ATCC 49193]ATZ20014.1 phosphate ABC transporter substrate-binding protein [Mesoplasma lactucae ATCC 49193]MCL8217035.1 hypothetical protein [Mesoplasma lactucae ATCC 49193]